MTRAATLHLDDGSGHPHQPGTSPAVTGSGCDVRPDGRDRPADDLHTRKFADAGRRLAARAGFSSSPGGPYSASQNAWTPSVAPGRPGSNVVPAAVATYSCRPVSRSVHATVVWTGTSWSAQCFVCGRVVVPGVVRGRHRLACCAGATSGSNGWKRVLQRSGASL